MNVRDIARIGEPVLRKLAHAVPPNRIGDPSLQTLIDDMVETMRRAGGAGIAAPQVYEPLRICVIELKDNVRYPSLPTLPLEVYINPEIAIAPNLEPDRDVIEMYEGCLSVPGLRGKVRRPRKLKLSYFDRGGVVRTRVFEGPTASVIQHEVDHLDGVLFVDRCDPRTLCTLEAFERHIPLAERVCDLGAQVG